MRAWNPLRVSLLTTLAVSSLALTACAPKRIPGTEILDTPDHRAVLDVMEKYRTASEALDADAVMALVSSDYFENNGTPEQEDDYGRDELAIKLAEFFGRSEVFRLDLEIKDVAIEDGQAVVNYHYSSRYQVKYDTGSRWHTHEDDDQMVLRKEDDGWRIVSGL